MELLDKELGGLRVEGGGAPRIPAEWVGRLLAELRA